MRDPTALSGHTLGPWTVEGRLGQGAMGAVYRAHRTARPAEVAALKVLRPEVAAQEQARARFQREAKALLRIDHPGCCRCLGHGEDDGLQWLALEFVAGQSLEQVLKIRGRLRPEEATPLLREVLQALQGAHRAGVVHRDLKPANVILTGEATVKLVDFGMARRRDESMRLTAEGSLLGTPWYMSPEQCAGETADARSDLYAAGALAFHLVAGRPPFQGRSLAEILRQHLEEPAPALSSLVPATPAALSAWVARALQKDPAARFADAGAALRALEGEAPAQRAAPRPAAPPAPAPVRGLQPARRSEAGSALDGWLLQAVAAAGAALLAALLALVLAPAAHRGPAGLVALLAGGWLGSSLARPRRAPRAGTPTLFLARDLLARGDARGAAQAYHALGQADEEARAWEAAGEPRRAAEALAGSKPEEAARLFEQAGEAQKAVDCLRRAGDLEGAATVLERQGRRDEAARLLGERAAELEARREREKLATRLARIDADLGRIVERASKLHRELGAPAEGARLLARIGRHREAAELYLEAGEREAAAAAWVAAGEPGRARELFERAGDVIAAARLRADELLRRGDKPGAAAELERAGDDLRAAALLEELGQPLRAAELYQRGGDPNRAATLFERAGRSLRAGELRARGAGPATRAPAEPPEGAQGAATGETAPDPQDEPAAWVGRTIDRYRIVDHLGSGGFAHVFRAEHVHLERPAALKLLRPRLARDPRVRERFQGEAKLVARLRHPAVVELFDFGEVDATCYMALELVEGHTLAEVIQARAPLPLPEVLELGRQLCEGLAAAHRGGVIHRDLKPENLVLEPGGQVRILDFGLARVFWGVEADAPGAARAAFAGTPRWAPPEAARGEVDARGDQYALGLVLYELATGGFPFQAETAVGWLGQHQSAAPAAPSAVRSGLPPAFDRALLRALEKRPEARFPDLAALAAALAQAQPRSGGG